MLAFLGKEVKDAWEGERSLGILALAHLFLGLVFVVLMQFDTRMLLGLNVWVKPSKFAFSIAIFVVTLMWLLVRLSLEQGERRWVRRVVWGAMVLEMSFITLQAARGVQSHFNVSSAVDSAMFSAMGLAILLNTWVVGQLAWWSLRREHEGLREVLVAGVRWGLVIFLVGSVVGGVMSGKLSHSVGVVDGGAGLPYVGWSVRGGDLRIAHFVGLHGIQALLLWAAALVWWGRAWSEKRKIAGVHVVGALYMACTIFTLVWALLGLPLIAR
ncbi:MAG: hypothetical protein H6727_12930 [Myxococcales bacterium]|nr:hypothetical protein [Myxococcales bacterium]